MHTLKNCLQTKEGTSSVIRNITSISRAKIVFCGRKTDFSTRVRFKESGYTIFPLPLQHCPLSSSYCVVTRSRTRMLVSEFAALGRLRPGYCHGSEVIQFCILSSNGCLGKIKTAHRNTVWKGRKRSCHIQKINSLCLSKAKILIK